MTLSLHWPIFFFCKPLLWQNRTIFCGRRFRSELLSWAKIHSSLDANWTPWTGEWRSVRSALEISPCITEDYQLKCSTIFNPTILPKHIRHHLRSYKFIQDHIRLFSDCPVLTSSQSLEHREFSWTDSTEAGSRAVCNLCTFWIFLIRALGTLLELKDKPFQQIQTFLWLPAICYSCYMLWQSWPDTSGSRVPATHADGFTFSVTLRGTGSNGSGETMGKPWENSAENQNWFS